MFIYYIPTSAQSIAHVLKTGEFPLNMPAWIIPNKLICFSKLLDCVNVSNVSSDKLFILKIVSPINYFDNEASRAFGCKILKRIVPAWINDILVCSATADGVLKRILRGSPFVGIIVISKKLQKVLAILERSRKVVDIVRPIPVNPSEKRQVATTEIMPSAKRQEMLQVDDTSKRYPSIVQLAFAPIGDFSHSTPTSSSFFGVTSLSLFRVGYNPFSVSAAPPDYTRIPEQSAASVDDSTMHVDHDSEEFRNPIQQTPK